MSCKLKKSAKRFPLFSFFSIERCGHKMKKIKSYLAWILVVTLIVSFYPFKAEATELMESVESVQSTEPVEAVQATQATGMDIVPMASVSSLSTSVNGKVTGLNSGKVLYLRKDPSTNNAQIGSFTNGASLRITGYTSDGWLRIDSPKAGYVYSQYVNVPAVSVSIAGTASVKKGKSVSPKWSLYPPCATNKSVTFSSSNNAVATVNGSGTITGKSNGTAKITLKSSGGHTSTCVVTVTTAVTGVKVSPTTASIFEGANQVLKATVAPSDASNKKITWKSSNTKVATVDTNGKVTAVKAGKADITVTTEDGGYTAKCVVTVTAKIIPVTSVKLSATTASIVEGANQTLTATVVPSNASNKKVTWKSSDTKIATVDANGKVTAVKAGKADITVTTEDGGYTAKCVVTVTAKIIPVTSVKLSSTTASIVEGANQTLTATVAPSNATNKKVTWKSSDTKIATVDANGKVTAVKAGKADITVTTEDGKYTAKCVVTVTAKIIPVTSVKLSSTTASIVEGANQTLTATVAPSNASNKKVTWKSSDTKIAKVDANGKVTAVKAGKTDITVTTEDGKHTAKCVVTVTAKIIPVTGIKLSPKTLLIIEGKKQALTATVVPSNASNKKVTWKSGNTKVATVDANGKVTAIKVGKADITVTTADGKYTAKCAVTVTTKALSTEIVLKSDFAEALVGDSMRKYDFDPLILKDSRSMVAARVIIDALAKKSKWTNATKTLEIVIDDYTFNFQIGRKTMKWSRKGVSGVKTVSMSVAPILVEGRTYFPVRYMMDAMGWNSYWNAGIKGEEYVVLTANKLNSTKRWNRINTAKSKENGNILAPTGNKINDTQAVVQARQIIDKFASGYEWDSQTQTLRLFIQNHTFNFQVNRDTMMWSKKGKSGHSTVEMTTRPYVVEGRTYIPVQYMAKVLGWGNYENYLRSSNIKANTKREITLIAGEKRKLVTIVLPDTFTRRNIESRWHTISSSNSKIVSVNETTGMAEARGAGTATITVLNAAGQKLSISVRVVLEAPKNLRVESYTHNSAKLTWTAVPKATHYAIERLSAGKLWKSVGTVGSAQKSFNITGLSSNTYYEFRVVAQASHSRTNSYNSVPAGTAVHTKLTPPANLRIKAVEVNTTTLAWNAVSGAWGYRVERYSGNAWVHVGTTREGHYNAAGLASNSVHKFRVFSQIAFKRNAARDSVASTVTVRTKPPAPTNLRHNNSFTHNSVRLQWNAVGNVNRYHIYRSDGTKIVGTGNKNAYISVTGLKPNTTYSFFVRAERDGGFGLSPNSKILKFTTKLAPPILRKVAVGETAVTIGWNAVPDAWGYRVERYSGNKWVHVGTGRGTTRAVQGLAGGMTYRFRVKAQFNEKFGNLRDSVWSTDLQVPTIPPIPRAPSKVWMASNTTSSITIAWNASAGATRYMVYRGNLLVGKNVKKTSFTLSMLSKDTSYNFRVSAVNASGESVKTSLYTFKTKKEPMRDVTKEVNKPLRSSAADAWYIRRTESQITVYKTFVQWVNHGAPWDIKREKSWINTIKTKFPGAYNTEVIYTGRIMTPEFLGNYTYGYLGSAFRIPHDVLIGGSVVAAAPKALKDIQNEIGDWTHVTKGFNDYLFDITSGAIT